MFEEELTPSTDKQWLQYVVPEKLIELWPLIVDRARIICPHPTAAAENPHYVDRLLANAILGKNQVWVWVSRSGDKNAVTGLVVTEISQPTIANSQHLLVVGMTFDTPPEKEQLLTMYGRLKKLARCWRCQSVTIVCPDQQHIELCADLGATAATAVIMLDVLDAQGGAE